MVEFALIAIPLFLLTIGLATVGQYFYQYNAMATAARSAARWASVVGGTCFSPGSETDSSADWCTQFNSGSTAPPSGSWTHAPTVANYPVFWTYSGNWPLQAGNVNCPSSYDPTFNGYYLASQFSGNTSATIVGAVANHLDTNSGSSQSSPFIIGGLMPGFDLSQLRVCIQPTWDTRNGSSDWQFGPGYKLMVSVYYPFNPVGGLLAKNQMQIVASSTYEME
jgi:TadE-like protein